MRPRPYPANDSAEQDAVTVFNSLIDTRYVKSDIRTRDKYPNIDGTIELVDSDQVPFGKLEIQIRAIPADQIKYSCPTSLVAYSAQSTTLPVLLICVDTTNKRAYWRHISLTMPELKSSQQSFTINFSMESDLIDSRGNYIQMWTLIASDYQDRISRFPILDKEVSNKIKLQDVDASDRELFQKFIDKVNGLFDNDFIAIKEILYPGNWKFGVGIVSSSQSHAQYQIYTIPYGQPSPLVCRSDSSLFQINKPIDNTICETWTSKESIADYEKAGKDFVLSRVREIIEKRDLPLYGQLVIADVLIAFVDSYYSCLGVAPGQDQYSVRDLDFAINNHLIQTFAALVRRVTNERNVRTTMDLDSLSQFLRTVKIEPITSTPVPANFTIQSRTFPVQAALSALRYLVANQIQYVLRPFGKRDLPSSSKGNWIWSGYSRENEVTSITGVLDKCIKERNVLV